MDEKTFEYLKPTDRQLAVMAKLRVAAQNYASVVDNFLVDSPDKTYILRQFRTVAMWANVCVTRETDGSPKKEN